VWRASNYLEQSCFQHYREVNVHRCHSIWTRNKGRCQFVIKTFLALNVFLWSTAPLSFFCICFEIVHNFMLTLLLGKHIAREMEILNWSSSFPTRSYSSHSPSCTSVQSPTRTSELLNTRKWEIALKWKCWEMNLPCQTASVLFLQVSLFFSS